MVKLEVEGVQALSGVKVIDLTHVLSGPYCTMNLGDMGAEVIKIEQYPHGDTIRTMPPHRNGESYGFSMINRNKKGMRLNLANEKAKEIVYKLVEDAEIFIENFRPGVAKKLGVDYETIKKINPEIIYCSISGYGQTGPYSHKGGFDIMAQGMSGIMSMTGEEGGKPVKVGVPIHDIGAGVTALYHILFAYIHKLRTGKGQYIDVSLLESALVWTVWEAAAYFGSKIVPEPTGTAHRRMAPYQGYRTKTGYILVGAANQKLWVCFCQNVINRPEWIDDPRYKNGRERVKYIKELEQKIEEIFIEEPSEYWIEKLEENGIPCSYIKKYDEVMNDEHILERDMILEYEHPVAGPLKTLGFPAKLSETPAQIRMPAPTLGQHTEEILSELNYTSEQIEDMKKEQII